MSPSSSEAVKAWLLPALLLAMAGCAGVNSSPAPRSCPEVAWEVKGSVPAELKRNIIAYWCARSQGDLVTSYGLEAPHIKWQVRSLQGYIKLFASSQGIDQIRILGARPVDGGGGKAWDVELSYRSLYDNSRVSVKERWVQVEGRYYHVLELMFGFIK